MSAAVASRFDGGVERLGWAVVAVALLFQNPYGELGPEADRFLVLQMLALVALALAALAPIPSALRVRSTGSTLRALAASALVRWALVVGGTGVVAAAASVDPLRSLLGAPPRLCGLASELALLVLFLALASRLSKVERRERLETALMAATGALVAYAVVQWAGLDPLRWQVDWQGRPTAAQGNPLFLAQALVWLAPMAAGRAIARWRAGERPAAAAAAVLALVAGAIALRTGERGPLLGLAAAGAVFVSVAGLSSPQPRARRAGVALAGVLGIALFAGSGLAWMRADQFAGTANQRLLLWRSVVRLFEASPPSRWLAGFGQESLPIVLPPFLPPELPERIWRPDLYHDRAHNAVLDAVAAGGLVRLLALLGLVSAAGVAALRLAGVRRAGRTEGSGSGERWRWVGLAAALAGHAVAAQFGVATAATATLFWLTLALIAGAALPAASAAALPARSGKRAAEALREGARRARQGRGVFAGAVLAVVAFGAWVPAQRAGDAMGGRVLLLLLAAAGGIALGLASGGAPSQPSAGRDVLSDSAAKGPGRGGKSPATMALAWLVAGAAGLSIVFVQLPELASGIALKQGRTALEAGRADLAVPLLARARRLAPNFEDPTVALARAEQRRAESAADAAQRDAAFARAAAVLAAGRSRHPGLALWRLEEAHLAARRADGTAAPEARGALFASAVASYREVLARDPQSSTVHRGLGAALLALGRLDEAGRELEASVRLAPRSLESRLLLGRLRLSAGDENRAREAFQAGHEIDPARARRLLEGLVRARPEDPSALRDLALFEIVEGRRKEAIAALELAMALTPPQDLPPLVRLVGLASTVP